MTIDTMLLGAGIFALILPSLGFPNSIDDVLVRIIGAAVITLAVMLRRGGQRPASTPKKQVFEESRPHIQ